MLPRPGDVGTVPLTHSTGVLSSLGRCKPVDTTDKEAKTCLHPPRVLPASWTRGFDRFALGALGALGGDLGWFERYIMSVLDALVGFAGKPILNAANIL